MIKNYEEAVAYIHSRPRLKKATTQKRILYLLNKLGNPQRQVVAVHVVGTNGKGSVVAYLMNLLEGINQRVGTFTSPFMIRFNERIMIDKKSISDEDLVTLVRQVKPIIDEIDANDNELGPSEFEVLTALGYLYFAQQKVDIALIEAGIGGETDSTNVDDQSLMTIITTIGMDHMNLLGKTISAIAKTKAKIIRPNTVTIVGEVPAEALNEIITISNQRKNELVIANQDYKIKELDSHRFSYESATLKINQIKTNLLGKFEMEDAGIAIAAFAKLCQINFKLTKTQVATTVEKQIQATRWMGRMEVINQHPLMIIDGAHNVPAIQKLTESLAEYKNYQIDLVMAVFADKQYQKMLGILKRVPNLNLHLTTFSPNEQRKVADFSFIKDQKISYDADWKKLIYELIRQDRPIKKRMIVVTGSLLFISAVRKTFLLN